MGIFFIRCCMINHTPDYMLGLGHESRNFLMVVRSGGFNGSTQHMR